MSGASYAVAEIVGWMVLAAGFGVAIGWTLRAWRSARVSEQWELLVGALESRIQELEAGDTEGVNDGDETTPGPDADEMAPGAETGEPAPVELDAPGRATAQALKSEADDGFPEEPAPDGPPIDAPENAADQGEADEISDESDTLPTADDAEPAHETQTLEADEPADEVEAQDASDPAVEEDPAADDLTGPADPFAEDGEESGRGTTS